VSRHACAVDDVLLLEELAANAWPPGLVQHVGGWRLRFSGGAGRRANSVLPNAEAGALGLDERIALAERFYAGRGWPARFQLSPAARPAGLDDALAARGYAVEARSEVHVAALADVLTRVDGDGDGPAVLEAPDAEWLAAWPGGTPLAADLLGRIGPRAAYALLRRDGGPVAVGRAVVERGWVGVFGMATRAEARRTGAATAILGALARWGTAAGADRAYLQVEAGNGPALALYAGAGFRLHHRYLYRVASDHAGGTPEASSPRPS
jgi:N-acetylglutamate synthase